MKKIKICCLQPHGACSWYRSIGPLSKLRFLDKDITVEPISAVGWQTISDADIMYFERPQEKSYADAIDICNQLGIPVWSDLDDLFHEIPDYNPSHKYFSDPKVIENIERSLRLSNVVTVTTPKLRDYYKKFNDNTIIIENAHDDYTYPFEKIPSRGKKAIIQWRGSPTHRQDLLSCAKEMFEMAKQFPEWLWSFVGDDTWFMTDKIEKHFSMPETDIITYYKFIKDLNPAIGQVPLMFNEFNKCKCLVGSTLVATDNGIKKIEDVYELKEKTGIWQENGFKKIDNFIKYENKKIIKIKTACGYKICGTPNHKLRVNGEFKQISELKKGDKVELSFFDFPKVNYQIIPYPMFKSMETRKKINHEKLNNNLLPKITINERWGRFLGYLLGDGHLNGVNRVSISCDSRHENVVNDIQLFADEIGVTCGHSIKTVKGIPGNGVDLHLSSKILRNFVGRKLGFTGVRGKILRVPDVIFNSPKSVIKEFLKGLFESDGTVTSSGLQFCTKQLELAEDIQFLLLGFKIKSKIVKRYNKKYNRYYYYINLGREALNIYYDEIGFVSMLKQKKLKEIAEKKHSNAFKEWVMDDEIVELEHAIEDVYDIEVPDGNFYMANGFISHNSNIGWIENTYSGATTIAPLLPEFSKPGVIRYTSKEGSYKYQLEKLIKDNKFRDKKYIESYEYIKDNLLLSDVNYKRLEIFEKLINGEFKNDKEAK